MNQEIQDNAEYHLRDERNRNIDQSQRGGFNERVVHSGFLMTGNDGTLGIQVRDFSHGRESTEEDGAA